MCRLSVAAAGMLMLFSCTDKSYRGSADTQFSPEESRLVIMSVGNTDNIILKGSGAIENGDYDVWDGKPIYVYAFKRDLMTSFAATSMDDSESCLIDASRDELGSLAGKRAKVGMLDAYVVWDGIEKAVYYHPGNYPYDFYAYYIDNMEVPSEQISRTDDSVSFPVEIDGSTDFMSAKAELTEEQLYRQDFTDEAESEVGALAELETVVEANGGALFYLCIPEQSSYFRDDYPENMDNHAANLDAMSAAICPPWTLPFVIESSTAIC